MDKGPEACAFTGRSWGRALELSGKHVKPICYLILDSLVNC